MQTTLLCALVASSVLSLLWLLNVKCPFTDLIIIIQKDTFWSCFFIYCFWLFSDVVLVIKNIWRKYTFLTLNTRFTLYCVCVNQVSAFFIIHTLLSTGFENKRLALLTQTRQWTKVKYKIWNFISKKATAFMGFYFHFRHVYCLVLGLYLNSIYIYSYIVLYAKSKNVVDLNNC